MYIREGSFYFNSEEISLQDFINEEMLCSFTDIDFWEEMLSDIDMIKSIVIILKTLNSVADFYDNDKVYYDSFLDDCYDNGIEYEEEFRRIFTIFLNIKKSMYLVTEDVEEYIKFKYRGMNHMNHADQLIKELCMILDELNKRIDTKDITLAQFISQSILIINSRKKEIILMEEDN